MKKIQSEKIIRVWRFSYAKLFDEMADWDLKEHGVGEDIIVYAKKLCLPTLMMSGLERNTVADKYLKKPININDLYKILDKYVKQ